MPTTSRILFDEIIDYAGLFPPAKLPLEVAFDRFLSHLRSEQGWLLARFVCPAARLAELTPMMKSSNPGSKPIRIAVLGTGGDDPPSYSDAIERDVEAMVRFGRDNRDHAFIDVFEVKLPREGDPSEVVDLSIHHIEDVADRPPMPFFEASLLGEMPDPRTAAPAIADASHLIDPRRKAGLKIRCGGLDAAAVPTVDAVAAAIIAGRDSGLPLKATQGLHHPIRHHDPTLDATVHGFLNLFAAAVLARAERLDDSVVREIIAEEDPQAFDLTESALRWRHLETGLQDVADGRISAITSFGSCSFSEPRDDLATLGWL